MTSEDKILNGFENLRVYIDGRFVQLERRLDSVSLEIHDNTRDIAHLQTSVYWGFAVMGIVVTLVSFVITLAPMFREMYLDARNRRNDKKLEDKVQGMIDAAIEKALQVRKQ